MSPRATLADEGAARLARRQVSFEAAFGQGVYTGGWFCWQSFVTWSSCASRQSDLPAHCAAGAPAPQIKVTSRHQHFKSVAHACMASIARGPGVHVGQHAGDCFGFMIRTRSMIGKRVAGVALAAGALLVSTRASAEPSDLPPQLGYDYSEIESARTAALGGAVRAFSSSIEALHSNPANLVAARVYHLGGMAQFWPGAKRQSYGAAVVDSIVSRSRVAGGLSANWVFQDPDGLDRSALDLRFGLAFPVSDKLLVGGAVRYLDLKEDGFPEGQVLPPSAASDGLSHDTITKAITFDAGVTIRPAEFVALSMVGQNLTDPGHGFLPLLFGGGVGVGTGEYSAELDVVADFTSYESTKTRTMIGLEALAADNYPLRLGYRYDAGLKSHALSIGAGYASREFSFDLGIRRVLGDYATTAIFLGLKYHVESLGLGGGGNLE
jgi:opacity protein-like surface antigen